MSKYKLNVINAFQSSMESQMIARSLEVKIRNIVLCLVKNYKRYGIDSIENSKNAPRETTYIKLNESN